nr:MAG TPA: hypothetical protein [Caudoviricetes sp.]
MSLLYVLGELIETNMGANPSYCATQGSHTHFFTTKIHLIPHIHTINQDIISYLPLQRQS